MSLPNMKDSMGRYRTLSLFKELNDTSLEPVFSLEQAYQIYMSKNTEYDVAVELLGSWEHWKKLLECEIFLEKVLLWREEKEEQLVAQGMHMLILAATCPDRKGKINAGAARWLAEKGFKDKLRKKLNKDTHKELQDKLLDGLTAELGRVRGHK